MIPLDLQLQSLGGVRNNNDALLKAKTNLNKTFIDQYSPTIFHQLSL